MKTKYLLSIKTILLIVLLSANFVIADAQDLKGRFFVGGSLGFDFTSASADINGTNYSNPKGYQAYNIDPTIAYCITDKLALGLQMGYGFETATYLNFVYQNDTIVSQYTYSNTTKTFSIAPLLRYMIPINDKLSFMLNLTTPYSCSKTINTSSNAVNGYGYSFANPATGYISLPAGNNNPITTTSYGLNISPGFQWFVRRNIAILGALGSFNYNYIKTESSGIISSNTISITGTAKSSDFKLALTPSMSLGVLFYFSSNK